jgi:hypothetical protein
LAAVLAVAVLGTSTFGTAGSPDVAALPVALVSATGFGDAAPIRPQGLLGGSGCEPGQVLNLDSWKLTLPIGSSGKPKEILPLNLGKLVGSPFFQATRDCEGVVFRAPVNGATTKGSQNPRSELREMGGGNGDAPASWSSGSGTHWMAVTEAFTKLPQGKPHLVGAQIHDNKDDVTVFRLEGTNLYVTDGDNPHYKLVRNDYQLGQVFQAAFLVTQNMVGAYYDGQLVAVLERPFANAYFKAGAYTQANCSNSPCSADNYGETVIYALDIGHR